MQRELQRIEQLFAIFCFHTRKNYYTSEIFDDALEIFWCGSPNFPIIIHTCDVTMQILVANIIKLALKRKLTEEKRRHRKNIFILNSNEHLFQFKSLNLLSITFIAPQNMSISPKWIYLTIQMILYTQFIYQFNAPFFLSIIADQFKAKAKQDSRCIIMAAVSYEYINCKLCKCKFDRFSLISWISENWLHFEGFYFSCINTICKKVKPNGVLSTYPIFVLIKIS